MTKAATHQALLDVNKELGIKEEKKVEVLVEKKKEEKEKIRIDDKELSIQCTLRLQEAKREVEDSSLKGE